MDKFSELLYQTIGLSKKEPVRMPLLAKKKGTMKR